MWKGDESGIKMIRCSQINLQRSSGVMAKLNTLIFENEADVFLVQEPYSVRGMFPRLTETKNSVGKHPIVRVVIRKSPGQPCMFVSNVCGTESNIDLTMSMIPAVRMLADWVVTYDSSSNHRLIRFSLSPVGRSKPDVVTNPRTCYIHGGTDWRVYDRVLLCNIEA
ncbi:hypothetical protein PR048_031841 [Dryococelus australis]|uniref:Endonuclease/exonuclease/phosphatase domain-containing protein n=1 Tax=Dryococelus australis TaxID=614101 RepID=A0ABQ9G979_9NEOP|nr:hypothetical protein PR048_031841 [Dryococelus australis]